MHIGLQLFILVVFLFKKLVKMSNFTSDGNLPFENQQFIMF